MALSFFLKDKYFISFVFFSIRIHSLPCCLCVEESFSTIFNPDINSIVSFNFMSPQVNLKNKT